MAQTLHRLLYVSRASIDPCGPEPRRILDVAAQRNHVLGVTGMLCFSGDHFAQLLEGETAALQALMARIRSDKRHQLLREWPAEPAPRRLFPGWAMAYTHEQALDAAMQRLVQEEGEMPLDLLAEVLFGGLDLYRSARQDEGNRAQAGP